MKILAVADEECKALWDYFTPRTSSRGVELIIACGDLSRHYLEYLATMAPVPLLYVHGNHDESYDTRPPQGVICLDDDVYVHKRPAHRRAGRLSAVQAGAVSIYTEGNGTPCCTAVLRKYAVWAG